MCYVDLCCDLFYLAFCLNIVRTLCYLSLGEGALFVFMGVCVLSCLVCCSRLVMLKKKGNHSSIVPKLWVIDDIKKKKTKRADLKHVWIDLIYALTWQASECEKCVILKCVFGFTMIPRNSKEC